MIVTAPVPPRLNAATLETELAAVPGVTEVLRLSLRTGAGELDVEVEGSPEAAAVRVAVAAHKGEPTSEQTADEAERRRILVPRDEAVWARGVLSSALSTVTTAERATARLVLAAWRAQQRGPS